MVEDKEGEGGNPVDFTPLMNFHAAENDTDYVAGLGYTATTETLKLLVQQWHRKGLVMLGRRSAQLGGHGTVT